MSPVRRLGALTESVHAVVYFAPEALEAYAELGLRGYWRGYFASRAGALGSVGAEVVTELFGGFAPSFVARAIPEVWTMTTPELAVEARQRAAAVALGRLLGDVDVDPAAALTGALAARVDLSTSPMAAAVARLPRPADPVGALWHDCTVLRELRGDAHLQAVRERGLRWPVPHLLARERVDPRLQEHRGWTDQEWQAAREEARQLGPDVVEEIESRTDELTESSLDGADVEGVVGALEPLARAIVDGQGIPFPNAMGLPRP